jgi:hypothetical protein
MPVRGWFGRIYAGGGKGTTRNCQLIDLYDRFGIIKPADGSPAEFAAGFALGGAVCVRHVRVKENTSLAELAATVLRIAHETGEVCTEEHAATAGASLVDRSPA